MKGWFSVYHRSNPFNSFLQQKSFVIQQLSGRLSYQQAANRKSCDLLSASKLLTKYSLPNPIKNYAIRRVFINALVCGLRNVTGYNALYTHSAVFQPHAMLDVNLRLQIRQPDRCYATRR